MLYQQWHLKVIVLCLSQIFLENLFSSEWAYAPTFEKISLIFLGILPIAFFVLIYREKHKGIFFTCLALAFLGSYMSPSFSVVRIIWAETNARFLLLILCLAGITFFTIVPPTKRYIGFLSILLMLYGIYRNFQLGITGSAEFTGVKEWGGIFFVAVFLLFLVVVMTLLTRKGQRRWLLYVFLFFISTLALLLDSYKRQTRYSMVRSNYTGHEIPKHWVDTAEKFDRFNKSYNLAVTGGFRKTLDSWFLYYPAGLNSRCHWDN